MKRKLLQLALAAIATLCSLNVHAQLSGFYQEDFEGAFPPSGWQAVDVLDPVNFWEQSNIDVYSGSYSAYINYTNYVPGEDWLILPQFTVAASDSISFWVALPFTGYAPDSTVILVSTTDDNLSSFTNVVATLSEGVNYPDTVDIFFYYAFSLSDFAGQDIYVAFKNTNNAGDGVFIDLVTIGSIPSIDAAAQSIDLPDAVSTVTPIVPKATVKNNAPTSESFSVTMNITGGYSSTKNVTNLAGGATVQVDFDSWLPASGAGDYTASIQTQLAGDLAPGNDTTSKVIPAYDPLSVYYQEDFEGTFPPVPWQIEDVLDPANTWQQFVGFPYSGFYNAFLPYSTYGLEGEDWFILPQFTVASTDSFSFWLALQYAGAPDSTYIMVSTTDPYLSSFTDTLGLLSDGINYPVSSYSYSYYSFSLADYAGQNIYVAFKNRNFYGDGIFVDLVTIGTQAEFDVAATSIDLTEVVSTVTPIIPKATVKNNSLTSLSFPVTMSITGGYSSTMNVNNLAAGASLQIDFDSWLPADTGDFTASIQTQLATDGYVGNDTVSKAIRAYNPLFDFYQEDFEGSFLPAGWQTRDVLDQPNTWLQDPGFPYSGYYSAFLGWSPVDVQGEDWLILPQFTVAATDSFSFWFAVPNTGYPPDSTSILVSTTDTYLPSFTNTLDVLSEGVNYPDSFLVYEYHAYSLAAYAGQNIYVAFKNRNVYGDGILVDLVSIGTPLGVGITQNTPVNTDLSSFPNPFSKFTSVSFSLDQSSAVRVSIVDVMGREVEELCNKTLAAGSQQIVWNATGYEAGVYFCNVNIDGKVSTQKLVKLN